MAFKIPFKKTAKKLGNKYIDEDMLSTVDRGIKTIGGVDINIPDTKNGLKVLFFNVRDVYEFLAALGTFALGIILLFLFALTTGGDLKILVLISFGVFSIAISRYTNGIKEYKARFERELPGFIDTMVQGLSVGLPIETVLDYVSKHKTGIVQPFIKEVLYRINSGESLEQALNKVAYKSLSSDFERVARVLSLRSQTTADIVKSLIEVQNNIEVRLENKIMSKAQNAENTFFLPILAGYIVPYLVIIMYPLLLSIVRFVGMSGR